jgi:hypothetical protein
MSLRKMTFSIRVLKNDTFQNRNISLLRVILLPQKNLVRCHSDDCCFAKCLPPLKVCSPPVKLETGNPYLKGRISTLDLGVATISNHLVLKLEQVLFIF